MSQMLDFTRRAFLVGTAVAATNSAVAQELGDRPVMRVGKDPNCGCCSVWIEHIQAAGFKTNVIEMSDLSPLKARLRIPKGLASCHTAEIDGYVIEGHVPAAAIKRLLTERRARLDWLYPECQSGPRAWKSPAPPMNFTKSCYFALRPTRLRAFPGIKGVMSGRVLIYHNAEGLSLDELDVI